MEKKNRQNKERKKIEKSVLIKVATLALIVVCILVLDLVTKYVFDASIQSGEVVSIIPGLFNFTNVHNIGAAWGMLGGRQAFLIAISVIFLVIFVVYYCMEKNKTWLLTICFSFLIGGCLGNLYDRAVLGYVRDFIQFDFWQTFPAFNFADAFLTIGVVLFVIYLVIYFVKEFKKSKILIEKPEKNDEFFEKNENIEEIDVKMQEFDEKLERIYEKTENLEKNSKNSSKDTKKIKKNAKKIEKIDKITENSSKNEPIINEIENIENKNNNKNDNENENDLNVGFGAENQSKSLSKENGDDENE